MKKMAENLMHAVQYSSYGGGAAGLKHVEVPIPTPKQDEVLLKLEATSLNPFDWKIQKGMLRPFLPRKFPYIPGTDVAGEVIKVGPGVKNYKAGDKVVAILNHTESLTIARPPEVSVAEVAGGVGRYAVQLAKLGNTHVTATCGARNMDLFKSLGANEVLDYKTPDGAALKSPSGRKYDAVTHCATGIPWSTFEPNLSTNGKLVPLIMMAKKENIDYLVKLVKERKLKTIMDSKHPLSKAEDAWAKSIDGHATGKIIVEP
ncbi:hypothetical protein CRYUN_Cryun23aG0059800 [Craigia yunnanensis]